MAELVLLIAVAAVPVVVGGALGYAGRPWWWGAVAAVAISFAAAIIPEPEAGEPRVAGDDVVFLLIVAGIVVALVWLGALVGRRLARGRT